MRSSELRVSAFPGSPRRDLLEEAHRHEMAEPVDAGIVGSDTVLLVEPAKSAVLVAAELIEPAFVARIVDRRGHARGALGREKDVVVGGEDRALVRLPLHEASPWAAPECNRMSPNVTFKSTEDRVPQAAAPGQALERAP